MTRLGNITNYQDREKQDLLAERLANFRRRAEITQADLAKKTGYSREVIIASEAYGRASVWLLEALAKFYEVKVDDLLHWEAEAIRRHMIAWRLKRRLPQLEEYTGE